MGKLDTLLYNADHNKRLLESVVSRLESLEERVTMGVVSRLKEWFMERGGGGLEACHRIQLDVQDPLDVSVGVEFQPTGNPGISAPEDGEFHEEIASNFAVLAPTSGILEGNEPDEVDIKPAVACDPLLLTTDTGSGRMNLRKLPTGICKKQPTVVNSWNYSDTINGETPMVLRGQDNGPGSEVNTTQSAIRTRKTGQSAASDVPQTVTFVGVHRNWDASMAVDHMKSEEYLWTEEVSVKAENVDDSENKRRWNLEIKQETDINIDEIANLIDNGIDAEDGTVADSDGENTSTSDFIQPSTSLTRRKHSATPAYMEAEEDSMDMPDASDSEDDYKPSYSCKIVKGKRTKRRKKEYCAVQPPEASTQGTTDNECNEDCGTFDLPRGNTVKRSRKKKCKAETKVKSGMSPKMVNVAKAYTCDNCGKQYVKNQHLQQHYKAIHLGLKPYSCDLCDKTFLSRTRMEDHRRSHTGEKPFQCNVCQKYYSSSRAIARHMTIHLGKFRCNMCQKIFPYRYELVQHMKKHLQ